MRFPLTKLLVCGLMMAFSGCQNPLGRIAKYGDDHSLAARLSVSSDDSSFLETGRGHSPSLASELADRRHETDERSARSSRGSASTARRLLARGYDADVHGRGDEARVYYEQVLAVEPEHPQANHRLGILADQAGDYAAAEAYYQTALRKNPHDADLLNDLGYSFFLQGRGAESERYLSQALRVEPRHPHVEENLSLLYDREKAEKVLKSLMGPRQTQATMTRLFQTAPAAGAMRRSVDRSPEPISNPPRLAEKSRAEVPHGFDELQRKMEAARRRSIAERKQRNASPYPSARPNPRAEILQASHAQPSELPRDREPGGPVPIGRINEMFRNIDRRGHSHRQTADNAGLGANRSTQVPLPNVPRSSIERPQSLAQHPVMPANARAAEPQWNQPPGNWPTRPPVASPPSVIQQASYSQSGRLTHRDVPSPSEISSAAQRAAEIGMAAGPGAIFPQWNSDNDASAASPMPRPAMRSLPGTNSRISGTMYAAPNEFHQPPQWNPAPAEDLGQAAIKNQPEPIPRAIPTDVTAEPYVRNAAMPPDYRPVVDPYDQMRSAQNVQYNQDQRQLAARPGLMTSGPPAAPVISGGFEPDRQPWPAYTREQYDTRQMDQPKSDSNLPMIVPGPSRHHSLPLENPLIQPASQNEVERW